MAKKVKKVEPQQDDRRIYNPIQKDYATFLETSEETGGEHTLIEIEVAPGGGTTPHYHLTYAEHFEVISGALEVMVGGEEHAPQLPQRHRRADHFPDRAPPRQQRLRKGTQDRLRTRYRRPFELQRAAEEPLPHGALVRVGRGTAAGYLRPPRAVVRTPGEAGPAQGDRPGAGGQVRPVGGTMFGYSNREGSKG